MKVLLLVGVVAIVVVIVLLVGLCMVVMAGFMPWVQCSIGAEHVELSSARRWSRAGNRIAPLGQPQSYPAEISAESTSVKRVNAATSPGSEWLTRGQA